MSEKMNVESFNLDHTKVKAPYVRLVDRKKGIHGDEIFKYDLRFCQPNKEFMDMPSLHSLEHLMAENIRNHCDSVIDLSPMGCQTGFYLTVMNHSNYDEILDVLEKTLQDVLHATEVPAANEIQCGNAKSHSLEGAKEIARKVLAQRKKWDQVFE
ncbi:S-ribosylhomocysteine lyase /quorum-sensing autoinducer 2 (AI-2) synthesis protein LuxS [Tepidibacillus fermentans]|uniref:S-ribosylhomocysteine lyase n=1 Tax=Tepidibacillus fermentans TaxID=1281767 RepID=A0A4R3KL94_9BACI|nr:S-ribosylhomocysteine lyase /quorum-sensing autoinducer 2 (AI-2) synthesis protein LuxS [Tepidibacillus fermentans]